MSLVAKLLSPENVVVDLQVSSKKRLFEQVGLLFENQHGLARSLVFDSLFARERLGSTGLGQGVLVQEKATEKHLQILSELAQMFSDKVLREAMSRAADAAALHQLISAWQPDAAGQRRAAA